MDIEFMKAIKKLSAQIVQATSVEIDKDKCKRSLFGWVLQKHHFIPIETKHRMISKTQKWPFYPFNCNMKWKIFRTFGLLIYS